MDYMGLSLVPYELLVRCVNNKNHKASTQHRAEYFLQDLRGSWQACILVRAMVVMKIVVVMLIRIRTKMVTI